MSDILDGAVRLIRRNPRVIIGLSAGAAVLTALLHTFAAAASLRSLDRIPLTYVSGLGTSDSGQLVGTGGVELVSQLASMLVVGLLTGTLTVAMIQDVLGVRMTVGQVLRLVRPRIGRIVVIAVLTTVVEFAGLFLFVVPGVWLWGVWSVAVPALMVEELGVRAALRRSRRLVEGTFWRVWGIRALGYLTAAFLAVTFSAPFVFAALYFKGGSAADSLAVPVVLTAIGQIIAGTITTTIRCGVDALLYVDLRMRKEGLDIQLQMAAQQLSSGTRAPGVIADAAW